jgi:hypothetical protein
VLLEVGIEADDGMLDDEAGSSAPCPPTSPPWSSTELLVGDETVGLDA